MRPARLDESIYEDLAARSGEDLVSIFIPTHRKGRDIAQDRIYLKNELSSVDSTLSELGWKPRERFERLQPAEALFDDVEFWEHQQAGLALYLDDDGDMVAVSTFRALQASSSIMSVFLLRPLTADLHLIEVPVLALTRDAVALFTATELGAQPVEPGLPSYGEVNWFVDREEQRQQHPDMTGTVRSRHGHEPSARADEDLARFLREVDSALKDLDIGSPLIVLGDDDLVERFSKNSRRTTISPVKSGVPSPFSPSDIHDRVSSVITALDRSRVDEAIAEAGNRLGVGMGTNDIVEAVQQAVSGRIGQLIIDRNAASIWGRLNEASLEVETHRTKEPGDIDLLDRLVVWSLDNGAEVLATESPIEGRPFIAIFRY